MFQVDGYQVESEYHFHESSRVIESVIIING